MSLSHSLSFSFSLFALSATTLIGATARGISNVSYIHIGKKKRTSETGKRVLISSGVRGLRSFSAFSFVENCVEAGHSWGKSTNGKKLHGYVNEISAESNTTNELFSMDSTRHRWLL